MTTYGDIAAKAQAYAALDLVKRARALGIPVRVRPPLWRRLWRWMMPDLSDRLPVVWSNPPRLIYWTPCETKEKDPMTDQTETTTMIWGTPLDQMKLELSQLNERLESLIAFNGSEEHDALEDVDRELLRIQVSSMRTYRDTLKLRVERAINAEEGAAHEPVKVRGEERDVNEFLHDGPAVGPQTGGGHTV